VFDFGDGTMADGTAPPGEDGSKNGSYNKQVS
jgi:hypothetical protein